jgi:hypothetical protein
MMLAEINGLTPNARHAAGYTRNFFSIGGGRSGENGALYEWDGHNKSGGRRECRIEFS